MPKRARYYQGILDTTSLYAGKKIKYNRSAKAVIILMFTVWDTTSIVFIDGVTTTKV